MRRLAFWVLGIILLGGAVMAKAQQAPPIWGQVGRVAQAAPPVQQPPPPPGPPGTAPPPPGGPPIPPATLPQDFLKKALQAVETARAARTLFTPGPVWIMKAPAGEVVVKAAILYRGVAVGALEFSPVDGALLPKGYRIRVYNATVSIEQIKGDLPGIMTRLQVLNGAEYREPEACWVVPLAVDGKIVAHVKVYYDGIHIVPDYPVDQEMRAYGK